MTIPKIDRLTPEQEIRLVEFREEWLQIGLCTDPADRPRAEAAIAKMYGVIGEKPPIFIWGRSPLECHLQIHLLEGLVKLDSVALGDSLRASLRASLGASLWASLGASLGDSLRDSLRDSLWASLRDSLWDSLRASLKNMKLEYKATWHVGQHDSYWIAFYAFCQEIGVKYKCESAKRLGWHVDIARSCCWWWPYRGLCFISDRPREVHMEDGRLHADSGPAVSFRDGWSLYAIGGVQVDEQIIMRPETQTIEQIVKEENEEIKRIRIERYGWHRYLADVGAEVIDHRWNDIEATEESLLRTPQGEVVLMCACPSTARVYSLQVPGTIQNCIEAQAWLSGGLAGRIINAA